ncbi:MAG TPA: glycoside hydrolase family 3 N-terminal domain-containing protein [Polyangiaceae bacterium]|nr:glycoside hydrolase family 3 N-terminal domain-containing protein [Polyangiaceae bacterium]
MSQKFRLFPAAITSVLMLAAVGCVGHSQEFLDEINKNNGAVSTGAGGSTSPGSGGSTSPSTGGDTGTSGGTGGGGSGAGGSGAFTCMDATSQQWDPHTMPGYTQDQTVLMQAQQELNSMTDPAMKYSEMQGSNSGQSWDFTDIERSLDVTDGAGNNIRGYKYRDAGRGVNLDAKQKPDRADDGSDFSTVFPVESARATSWDVNNEYDVGEAMGDEVAGSQNNMLLAPCMNIIRHPYWGRTQETYGEDMYHVGRMASAMTAGIQAHVASCAKHFAANNIENGRATQNAQMDEQTLREIYSRHFEMVVQDGGVAAIMASYNLINGTKNTVNKHLLTDILRTDFGFKGLVLSDWWAMPPGEVMSVATNDAQMNTINAVNAGLNIELPWWLNFGQLPSVLGNGVTQAQIDELVRQILEQKFRFKTAHTADPWGLGNVKSALAGAPLTGSIATNNDHLQLAEDTEVKSAVLLTNGAAGKPVLPLGTVANIAVVGAGENFSLQSTTVPKSCTGTSSTACYFNFAKDVVLGDRGSSRVNADPSQSVSVFQGLQNIGATHGTPNVTATTLVTGADVATIPSNADVIVMVVGYTPGDEGEEYAIAAGGDRSSLELPSSTAPGNPPGGPTEPQSQLVSEVLALNKPTVIIVMSGSIVNVPWLSNANQNQATIWAGYGGIRQGNALARLMFADKGANFSGKTALAWPLESDLPQFKDPSGTTVMGYFFGYRLYDQLAAAGTPKQLVFPFGHGMSYTTFDYTGIDVPCTNVTTKAIVNVTAHVKNSGTVAGDEVVFLWVKGPQAVSTTVNASRPVKVLASFAKQHLEAGAEADVSLPVRVWDLKHWNGGNNGSWGVDPGQYTVLVGPSGDDKDLKQMGTFTVGQ